MMKVELMGTLRDDAYAMAHLTAEEISTEVEMAPWKADETL